MCYQNLRKVTSLTLEITDLSHVLTFVLRSVKRSFLSIYLIIVEIMILSLYEFNFFLVCPLYNRPSHTSKCYGAHSTLYSVDPVIRK